MKYQQSTCATSGRYRESFMVLCSWELNYIYYWSLC